MGKRSKLRRGIRVQVPWGFQTRQGRVVDVLGDPPRYVRIDLELAGPDNPEEIVTILLGTDLVEVVQPA